MQVYTDEDTRSFRKTKQSLRVFCDLVKYIEKSCQNITCDNFFTKLSLARKLFLKRFALVETIKKKTELPTEFTVTKERNLNSTVFGFRQDAIIALYYPKTLCS